MPINLPDNVGAMTEQQKLNLYADLYRAGNSDADIRAAADAKYGKQSDADWDYLRMNAPTQSIQPIKPPVGSGSASSNGLTADIARDLMYRSMTTGAPTSEFDRYGGYSAVKSLYDQGGGQLSLSEIPADRRAALANTIANTGVGNLSLLRETNTPLNMSGVAAMQNNGIDTDFINKAVNDYGVAGFVTDKQFSGLQGRYDTLNTNYGNLQNQLNALQAQYDALRRRNTTSSTGSTTGGSGVVSGSGTTVDGDGAPAGGSSSTDTTMGAVYGPDGTMYSSPAAARAAGVFNYTRVRPTRTNNPTTTATANPTVNATPTGSGGGLISNVQQTFGGDSFFTNNAEVGLPAGVRAAF